MRRHRRDPWDPWTSEERWDEVSEASAAVAEGAGFGVVAGSCLVQGVVCARLSHAMYAVRRLAWDVLGFCAAICISDVCAIACG